MWETSEKRSSKTAAVHFKVNSEIWLLLEYLGQFSGNVTTSIIFKFDELKPIIRIWRVYRLNESI